eukprot:3277135-Ditylum_brightwellii.AAC.1
MCWDFQAAKQYMHDNNLEYVETGESKQCDCIKNLTVKGKRQYIRCVNTFLEKHTGFSVSISCTGYKTKPEYGDLKMDFLNYHNKGKRDNITNSTIVLMTMTRQKQKMTQIMTIM